MLSDAILDHLYNDIIDPHQLTNNDVLHLISVLLVNSILDAEVPGEALDVCLASLRRFAMQALADPQVMAMRNVTVGVRH